MAVVPTRQLDLAIDPVALEGMSERDLVDALRSLEDAKAQICATQAGLTRRLESLVRARHEQQRVPASRRGADVAGLVAFARRESPARGSRLVGFARALAELPQADAAMADGALSEWRAMLVARETACLSVADRAVVEAEICARRPDGTHPFDGWGDRRLVAELQAAVVRVDPAALVNRRASAEADRAVSLRPAPDTMARLSALLPAAQGVAVWATLSRHADTLRAAGDPRSRRQVMADTLVERVTGQSRADHVPVTVDLVVSDDTLLGGGAEPGWLQGYGPIAADAFPTETLAAVRRLYASPATGALVSMDSVARAFPSALATYLELRDRVCRTPWCDAPIRHHDHVVDHAAGGPTSAVNGQGLCEQCNHTKQAPGWRSRPITGPPREAHVVETELPTGHRVRSRAPAPPTPSRLRARTVIVEIVRSPHVIEWAA